MHTVVFGWFGGSAVWFIPLLWRLVKSVLPGGAGLRGPGTIRLWLGFVCVLVASCTLEAALIGVVGVNGFGHALAAGLGHLLGHIGTPLAALALLLISLPWLIDFRWRDFAAWADGAFGLGLSRGLAKRDEDARRHRSVDDGLPTHVSPATNTMAPKSNGRYARPTVWRPPAGGRGVAGVGGAGGVTGGAAGVAGAGGIAAARDASARGAAGAAAGWRSGTATGRAHAAPAEPVLRTGVLNAPRQAPLPPLNADKMPFMPSEPVAPAGWLRDPAPRGSASSAGPMAGGPDAAGVANRDAALQAGRRAAGEQRPAGSPGGGAGFAGAASAAATAGVAAGNAGAASAASPAAVAATAAAAASRTLHGSTAARAASGASSSHAASAARAAQSASRSTSILGSPAGATAPATRAAAPRQPFQVASNPGGGNPAAATTAAAGMRRPAPAYTRPMATTEKVTPPASVQETLRSIAENAARWTDLAGVSLARNRGVEDAMLVSGASSEAGFEAGQSGADALDADVGESASAVRASAPLENTVAHVPEDFPSSQMPAESVADDAAPAATPHLDATVEPALEISREPVVQWPIEPPIIHIPTPMTPALAVPTDAAGPSGAEAAADSFDVAVSAAPAPRPTPAASTPTPFQVFAAQLQADDAQADDPQADDPQADAPPLEHESTISRAAPDNRLPPVLVEAEDETGAETEAEAQTSPAAQFSPAAVPTAAAESITAAPTYPVDAAQVAKPHSATPVTTQAPVPPAEVVIDEALAPWETTPASNPPPVSSTSANEPVAPVDEARMPTPSALPNLAATPEAAEEPMSLDTLESPRELGSLAVNIASTVVDLSPHNAAAPASNVIRFAGFAAQPARPAPALDAPVAFETSGTSGTAELPVATAIPAALPAAPIPATAAAALSPEAGLISSPEPQPEPPVIQRPPVRGHAPANGFEFRAPAASMVELPTLDLLAPADTDIESVSEEKLIETGLLIEQRLQEFKVPVTVVGASAGPVITRFEVEPALGVRGSQIVGLMKDLSRGLGLTSIRVVETIPGKTCMGLELPNAKRQTIRLSEILEAGVYQNSHSQLTLAMGKDITGHPVVADLAKAPHMLVAGTTGSGKSVAINAMICSLLYKATPEEVRLIMIDPKMLELSVYEGIPHLLAPVVTDMKLAANALNWCVGEMEKRYRLMSAVGVRNLAGFNQKIRDTEANGKKLGNPFSLTPEAPEPLAPLPLIVVVIDELADLMMVAGKKIEELIARLAQKARAAGIHLILATQRPSVDVITGLIKANIPTRVAFQVSSKIDSRTILDQMGAESLLGQGDMLFLPPGTGYPQRVHGAFVADEEVHRIVEYLKQFGEPQYEEGILDGPATDGGAAQDLFGESPDAEADPLYDEAVAFVVRTRRASISSVQRQLRIGYNRAARLVEQMETAGLVSAMSISGSREVLAPGPAE